ncbi:hypothetical protein H8E88_11505 [candidate division KSB1 bacterium]|nr:hypothetical protein [candidate division KSB1 bacterium]
MDELITIMIIIGVIISFLSKIFRQKKEEAKKESTPSPVAKPKPGDWQPPWFEDTESDQEFSIFEEEKKPVFETVPELVKETSAEAETINFEPIVPDSIDDVEVGHKRAASPELTEFSINLKTANDIRQGIVLAEILGPCRANKKRVSY